MITYTMAQRTPEWFAMRVGRLTSSRVSDIFGTLKNGQESASRRRLRVELALERLTGRSQERVISTDAMTRGLELEATALAAYESHTATTVGLCGFVAHDTLWAGASPDGVIGPFEGLVEIKVPLSHTHWNYLVTGRVPVEYDRQILHQLWITDAQWCDFVSFSPDFPESLQLKIIRCKRTSFMLETHVSAVKTFLREVEQEVCAMEEMMRARLYGGS